MERARESYLLIQTAFIGDAILLTSLVNTLRREAPGAQIEVLVRKGNEVFFADHPGVHVCHTWDKQAGKYRTLFRLVKTLRKKRYHCVINLQRFGTTGLLTTLLRSRIRIGFRKNPFSCLWHHRLSHHIGDGTHETERNAILLSPIFGPVAAEPPRIFPSAADKQAVSEWTALPAYVCLFPGSVWKTKQLPEAKWLELIKSISQDIHILLMGAPGEKALCERLLAESGRKNGQNLAGRLSLMQSAALAGNARMNYVNDSAPLHMMSAMNAPVTAFFCSTVPRFGFTPLSDHALVCETDEELDCRPCGLHGKKECPLGHFNCGYGIDIPQPVEPQTP